MRAAFAALILLGGCGASTGPAPQAPSPSVSSAVQSSSGACAARAARDWMVGGKSFMIEATAEGPSCRDAVARLAIRTSEGRALYANAYPLEQVPLAFNPNADATRLASDLQAWIQGSDEFRTADQLPAWPEGAAAPPGFTPKLARVAYEGVRTEKASILCFPDGGESNACIALIAEPVLVQEIGSLTPERR